MISRRRLLGFTLVELLVVIGIISILISILLPVVSRAQDQARSAACKSNIRQLFVATQIYSNNNKGSLPYGLYWPEGGGEGLGNPRSTSRTPYVSWFTLLNNTMDPRSNKDITNGWAGTGARMGYDLSKVFRCPGAMDFPQQVHYYQNPIAMVHLPLELKSPAVRSTGSGIVRSYLNKPANFTDLYNDNALFWDTPLLAAVPGFTPLPFVNPDPQQERGTANSVLAASYIDGGSLRLPLQPELRFRYPDRDLFAGSPDSAFVRGDQSIAFLTDEAMAATSNAGNKFASQNSDIGGTTSNSLLLGNVRFRHQRNSIANVAFADGSVQAMTFSKSRVIGGKSYDTTFKRNMLRIKWPTGFGPSDQLQP